MGACQQIILSKSGEQGTKVYLSAGFSPAKKRDLYFCDGEVFFLDRSLLMGAIVDTRAKTNFIQGFIRQS
jgi:hypothetical protein